MPDYKATLEELAEARNQAREVLQELHGTLKDVKRAKAEVLQMLRRGTAIMVLEALNEALDSQVAKVNQMMESLVNEASNSVARRFNEVAEVLEKQQEHLEDREKIIQETSSLITTWLDRQKERGHL